MPPLHAQGTNGGEGTRWRVDQLHHGFCVQFLVERAAALSKVPDGSRLLRADNTPDLHPALRSVIQGQPEFASWTPSHLCLLYVEEIGAGGNRLREDEPRKMPLIGLWTVASLDARSDDRRDLVLELFTTSGRLERWGRNAGLFLKSARSEVAPVPPDDYGIPSGADRYRIRIGKTELIWVGRPGQDSTAQDAPVVREWLARGRQGDQVRGRLSLMGGWSRAMIGSLKVQGKDELAGMLQASPIRFVGPAIHGGQGSFEFTR